MTEAVNVDDLKDIIARVNKRMDDRDDIGDDIRDLYTLAKSRGYNTKAMRRVIADMRADPAKRKALEADVDLYRAALGIDDGEALVDPAIRKAVAMREAGKSLRDIEKATGVSKSTLHRLSHDSVGRDTPLAAVGAPSPDVLPPAGHHASTVAATAAEPIDGAGEAQLGPKADRFSGDSDPSASRPTTDAEPVQTSPRDAALANRVLNVRPAVEPTPEVVLLDGVPVTKATSLPPPSVQALGKQYRPFEAVPSLNEAVRAAHSRNRPASDKNFDFAQAAPDDGMDLPQSLRRGGRGA